MGRGSAVEVSNRLARGEGSTIAQSGGRSREGMEGVQEGASSI